MAMRQVAGLVIEDIGGAFWSQNDAHVRAAYPSVRHALPCAGKRSCIFNASAVEGVAVNRPVNLGVNTLGFLNIRESLVASNDAEAEQHNHPQRFRVHGVSMGTDLAQRKENRRLC